VFSLLVVSGRMGDSRDVDLEAGEGVSGMSIGSSLSLIDSGFDACGPSGSLSGGYPAEAVEGDVLTAADSLGKDWLSHIVIGSSGG
jgi:hypothetical protein